MPRERVDWDVSHTPISTLGKNSIKSTRIIGLYNRINLANVIKWTFLGRGGFWSWRETVTQKSKQQDGGLQKTAPPVATRKHSLN